MKVFMKNWQPNKTKQFRLHSLLRIYSLVMIIIISCFALLISYADWDMREREANRVGQRVLARTVDEVEYYYSRVNPPSSGIGRESSRTRNGIYSKYLVSARRIIFTGS